jgi:branched-chain amino acid transport system substrate-binding protein
MNKVLLSVMLIVLVVGVAVAGCAKPAPSTAPTPAPAPAKTLDIGVATPLTGPMSFVGTTIQNAVLLAIDDQNNEGGVTIGGQNYKLNPIVRDTKQDLVLGKSIAEELIFDKGVKVIMGPFVSDAIGAQPVIEKNKVIGFLMQPTLMTMTGPDKPYTFFFGGSPEQFYNNTSAYTQKFYPELKKVLTISPDIPSLPIFEAAIKRVLPHYGQEWMGMDKFPLNTIDLTPVISRELAKKPDILDAGCAGGMAGMGPLVPKLARAAGFTGPVIMPMSPAKGALEEVVPAQSLTKVIMNDYDLNSAAVTPEFRAVYDGAKQKFGGVPDMLLFNTYNVTKAFFEFLNTQTTMDTTAWMEAFAQYRWQNIFGFENHWLGKNIWGIDRRVWQCPWVSEYIDGKVANQFSAPLPDFLLEGE